MAKVDPRADRCAACWSANGRPGLWVITPPGKRPARQVRIHMGCVGKLTLAEALRLSQPSAGMDDDPLASMIRERTKP